jgi:hypothetical protein
LTDPSSGEERRLQDEASVLFDEYKILQDKIDKIGAFRVTIKGWSVTAAVAALVAISTDKGFSPWVNAAALNVLLAWFFWFEREQVRLGWKFNGRVRSIEIQIENRRRATGSRVVFSSPNIARSLFGGKRRKELIRHVFSSRFLERRRIWVNDQARLARGSDIIFYLTLCVATWVMIWFDRPARPTPPPIVIQNTINVPNPTSPKQEPSCCTSVSPAPKKKLSGGGK